MSLKTETALYDKVVSVTHEYLGPASARFVARQIQNHLKKSPAQLHKQDLRSLIDWASLAMAHLIEDEAVVHKYAADLKALCES